MLATFFLIIELLILDPIVMHDEVCNIVCFVQIKERKKRERREKKKKRREKKKKRREKKKKRKKRVSMNTFTNKLIYVRLISNKYCMIVYDTAKTQRYIKTTLTMSIPFHQLPLDYIHDVKVPLHVHSHHVHMLDEDLHHTGLDVRKRKL